MSTLEFYLGTHIPSWLTTARYPLFVAWHRLAGRKTMPRAACPWALDSGGFSVLQHQGEWTVTPREYAAGVRRCRDETGMLAWAAPQDWMCEPAIIDGGWHNGQYFAGTHLSVAEHQRRTVENFLELRMIAPDLPFIPVLQGYALDDYRRCADLYEKAGVSLAREPRTGLGSVCRRQATAEIACVAGALADDGLRLHGFGVKTLGLAVYAHDLVSADSLAWSARGRRVKGCAAGHATEANCPAFASAWRARVLAGIPGQQQMRLALFGGAA